MEGGKQRKEGKGGKKASRASTPATDAATSGGEDAEDRWDFECIECGQEGDPLLCCEVRMLTVNLLIGTIRGCTIILEPSGKGSSSAEHAYSLVPCEDQAVWPTPSPAICTAMLECKLRLMDVQFEGVLLKKCVLSVGRQ